MYKKEDLGSHIAGFFNVFSPDELGSFSTVWLHAVSDLLKSNYTPVVQRH